jgi:eukaryotic-like serine/threonine-protein kinase
MRSPFVYLRGNKKTVTDDLRRQPVSPAAGPQPSFPSQTPFRPDEPPALGERPAPLDNNLARGAGGPGPGLALPAIPGYEVLGEVGRAGMGVVYKARHRALDRLVAIKMLRDGARADREQVQRFITETQILARLDHPDIIRLLEVGECQGQVFMALEYADGGTLADLLGRHRLTQSDAAGLVERLARAVHHAHQRGILHRDLKPANILLSVVRGPSVASGPGLSTDNGQSLGDTAPTQERPEGDPPRVSPSSILVDAGAESRDQVPAGSAPDEPAALRPWDIRNGPADRPVRPLLEQLHPKIADFGLGRREQVPAQTLPGTILGTPAYMSPEQARGLRALTAATDVYALGVILYEALSGCPPFLGPDVLATLDLVRNAMPRSLHELVPSISPELDGICLKCLDKEPEGRYASALELAEELSRALAGRPLVQTPLDEKEESRRRRTGEAAARGLQALESGQLPEALLWFAEALQREVSGGRSRTPWASHCRTARWGWEEELLRIRIGVLLRQAPRLVQLWFPESPPVRAAFGPQGCLAAAGEDGTIRILDPETGRVLTRMTWHQGGVNALSFSADGRLLASAGDDGTARVWDPATGEGLSAPLRHPGWVTQSALSPDGLRLVTGCVDGTARVWDWVAGQALFLATHGGMLWSVGFCPRGETIYTAGWDGLCRTWDAHTGWSRGIPMKHGNGLRLAAFSPDGLRLATGGEDGTARVWSVATGEPVTWPLRHPRPVRQLAFSQDGRWLLTVSGGEARCWDAETGEPGGNPLPAAVLAGQGEYNPEGRRADCGRDGLLRLWDWGYGQPAEEDWDRWSLLPQLEHGARQGSSGQIPRLRRHTPPADLPVLATFPDGRLQAVQGPDGNVRVLAASGEPVTRWLPCQGWATVAVFGAEGWTLTVADEQGRQQVWDLSPERRPAEDLVHLVQLLTGHELDDGGSLREVEAERLFGLWEKLRGRYPDRFEVRLEEKIRWHDEAVRACEGAGLWAEAVGHLDALQVLEPRSALPWGRKGRVWLRAGLWAEAVEAYSRAIEQEGAEWVYWHGRGLAWRCLGHWDQAARDFGQAAEQGGGWRSSQKQVLALVHLRRYEEAAAALNVARAWNPRAPEIATMHGFLHAHLGLWPEAAAGFARGRALGERRPWARYLHALVCLRRKDIASYQNLCRDLLKEAEESRDVNVGAWAAWTCVVGANPAVDSEKVLLRAEQVGKAYQQMGSELRAFSHTLTGAALCAAGRWEAAILHLEVAPTQEGSPWDWLLLARAHRADGDRRAARRWLNRAMRWLHSSRAASLRWHQRLELRFLLRQARPRKHQDQARR